MENSTKEAELEVGLIAPGRLFKKQEAAAEGIKRER